MSKRKKIRKEAARQAALNEIPEDAVLQTCHESMLLCAPPMTASPTDWDEWETPSIKELVEEETKELEPDDSLSKELTYTDNLQESLEIFENINSKKELLEFIAELKGVPKEKLDELIKLKKRALERMLPPPPPTPSNTFTYGGSGMIFNTLVNTSSSSSSSSSIYLGPLVTNSVYSNTSHITVNFTDDLLL